ncbi:hypothetical protein LXL04_029632 [Taraxacum kok-saghyz]
MESVSSGSPFTASHQKTGYDGARMRANRNRLSFASHRNRLSSPSSFYRRCARRVRNPRWDLRFSWYQVGYTESASLRGSLTVSEYGNTAPRHLAAKSLSHPSLTRERFLGLEPGSPTNKDTTRTNSARQRKEGINICLAELVWVVSSFVRDLGSSPGNNDFNVIPSQDVQTWNASKGNDLY